MVIDLDLDPGPAGPDDRRRRDAATARRRWRAGLAGCLALLLLSVAGDAPTPPSPLVEVAMREMVQRTEFAVQRDRLFVGAPDPGMPTGRAISAYELPGGRLLWTAPHPGRAAQISARLVGDILLIGDGLGNAGLNPTTALDATTGRLRWRWPGQLLVAGDGRTGLGWRQPDDPAADRLDAAVLDLASGATLWSIPGTSGRLLFEPDRELGPHLLLLTPAGGVEMRELRTGAKVETRTGLPPGTTAATLVGDTVFLSRQRGDRTELSAYAVHTLAPQWSRVETEDVYNVIDCGRLVCVYTRFGLTAFDQGGMAVWHRAEGERESVWERGGRLLITEGRADYAPVCVLIDPATGLTLLELTGWHLVGRAGVSPTAGDGPFLVVRSVDGGSRSWFASVDPGDPALRTVAAVPYSVWNCRAGTASVVCRVGTDRLGVWAYRGLTPPAAR